MLELTHPRPHCVGLRQNVVTRSEFHGYVLLSSVTDGMKQRYIYTKSLPLILLVAGIVIAPEIGILAFDERATF